MSGRRRYRGAVTVAGLVAALCLGAVATASAQVIVKSDTSWKMTSAPPPAGWNSQVGFDDSGWTDAIVNLPNAALGSHTTDRIWDHPDGSSGSSTVYFRKVFTTPAAAVSALFEVVADDDVQVWVNGTLVINNADCLASAIFGTNVQPYLVNGQNLIAVTAVDCGGYESFGLYLEVAFSGTGSGSSAILDPFQAALNSGAQVYAVEVQPDGKVLVGGSFSTAGVGCGATTCPAARSSLARFHQDGSLDLSFNPGTNNYVYAIAVQPDGRILVGGNFTTIGGGGAGSTARPYLARLNADGSVDDTFIAGVNDSVYAIALQPDGKILVGGTFSSLGVGAAATARNRLGRLHADGTVDPGFNPGANGGVYTFSVQADGRIYVGGTFSQMGGATRNRIGLLASDGTVDSAFAPSVNHPSGGGVVLSITVQTDGQVIVGGFFNTIGGTSRFGLARVSAAGVVDASFDPGLLTFLPDIAQAETLLQTDGKIVVGGYFESVGNTLRPSLGRINSDGTVDLSFNPTPVDHPNSTEDVYTLRIDDRGRILVGGDFRTQYGAARDALARLRNPQPASSVVTVSGGGATVTWTRGGSSQEVDWVTFEQTLDGLTWTMLGTGTRVAGGWELTGQSVAASAVIRARGFIGGSIIEGVYLPAGINFIRNPSFTGGAAEWLQFATPDMSYMVSSVNGGVFEFWRAAPAPGTTNQAVVFQDTGLPIPRGTPLTAQFQLGNSDSVWKRVTVILHDRAFGDLAACLFWLPPGAPLQNYAMAARSTQIVASASLSFYAASVGSFGGSYRLDNVSLQHVPGAPADQTICTDPTTPAPPAGSAGPNLLVNGDFAAGLASWGTFGQILTQVNGGVAEFIKLPGTPGGTLLQFTNQPIGAGEVVTATLSLANNSPVRKRVMVLIHDSDFSDLSGCSFWIPPGQALTGYTLRLFAREAWANATLSIYPATVGPDLWIRLDDVVLQRTPAVAIVGTECTEPPPSPDVAGAAVPSRGRQETRPSARERDSPLTTAFAP